MLTSRARSWSLALGALLLVSACSSSAAPTAAPTEPPAAQTEPPAAPTAATSPEGYDLAGKRVLISPYWLDNFNTPNGYWIKTQLEEWGAAVDIVNPNAVASKQANILEQAIASQNYDLVIWQPVDATAAKSWIKKLNDAGIEQLLNFTSVKQGEDGLNFPIVSVDWTELYYQAGVDAATWIKGHPEWGDPKLVFLGNDEEVCALRLEGLTAGLKSVMPNSSVVNVSQSTKDATDGANNMTDFINREVPFNVAAGCGGSPSLGMIAALQSAGMAGTDGTTEKNPNQVYILSDGATTPELEYLWNKDVSLMRSALMGPKDAADQAVEIAGKLLTGAIKGSDNPNGTITLQTVTPDCATWRPITETQYKGVEGLNLPECSFSYTGQ